VKTLNILWQRLVDEHGRTCDRCSITEAAVNQAVQKLKRFLHEQDRTSGMYRAGLKGTALSVLSGDRVIAGESTGLSAILMIQSIHWCVFAV